MKYILFDIDGTLWDAVPRMQASWNTVLKSRPESAGRALTLEETYSLMGHTGEEIAAYTLPRLPGDLRMEIMGEAFAREHEDLKTMPGIFYPGVGETMRKLSAAGYGIAIISNCQDGYIGIMLSHSDFQDCVIDSECSGRTGLPKGDNIRLLLERNHVSADDAVYVGDTAMDEAASRAASTASSSGVSSGSGASRGKCSRQRRLRQTGHSASPRSASVRRTSSASRPARPAMKR